MNLNLNGLTALVTASTGGIGLEIARSLAIEGARVIVNGRTQSSVEKALTELRRDLSNADLVGLAADNGTVGGCATTLSTWPQVDILVNNLGIYEAIGFFDETDGAWQKMFEINIMSGVRLARQYLKGMLERGHGRLVFISSESGISPAPEMAHYSATKTMQLGIARSLAENRPTSLIGRLIDPREIGDIVAFVCSARASVINGSCIRAEGGLVRTIC